MIHKIDLTGDYETTIYDVARRLLAESADPGARVETRRSGVFSMSGIIGDLAQWQVAFAAAGPRLARQRGCISGSLTAKSSRPAQSGISAPEGHPGGSLA
jgi:hypothetical protein